MKKILICFILIFKLIAPAQDYIFFSDSPTNNFYDPSWGFVNQPSTLELINGSKFPVSSSIYFSGLNSLKLHWDSKPGGDWGLAVAEEDWPGHNITNYDSISFYLYSDSLIEKNSLPVIFIEDLSNVRTPKVNLSAYLPDILLGTWTKVFVPLSVFKSNPGSTDLTKIKTIFFGQSLSDAKEHTIYIDEIRIIKSGAIDTIPPSTPSNITASGYDKHIDIKWNLNSEKDIYRYNVYRLEDTSYIIGQSPSDIGFYTDWIGESGISHSYRISAVDSNNNESDLSNIVSASTYEMDDEELLDMVQEATFRYFWDYAHPVSGLARERLGSGDVVTSGGSGFGVMAILAGVERGFVTREQGAERILKIINFLSNADRFHGAWSHWLNGETGEAIPFSTYDDGGDLVETSFMIQGLLAARKFFNENNETETEIRNIITSLWETVEWDWYKRYQSSSYLYWHWSPNYQWQMNFQLKGPNETMITYLLAIASPTHGISPNSYYLGWASSSSYKNGKTFYGYPLYVGWDYGGPLFFAHYSFLGFDPRNKKDKYANYFINNRNHTLINRAYCIDNPEGHTGYNENIWGLTASDDPDGYSAHEPVTDRDNGTITPTAALSSFPYTPEESMAALKSLYKDYGEKIWGVFGFKDAFNVDRNWYAESYLAIDQGPIIVMIENHRSGLLWKNFMANPEIQPMLDSIGFVPDLTDVSDTESKPVSFELKNNYPNPFNPSTTIEYTIPEKSFVKLKVYSLLGEEVAILVSEEKNPGNYSIIFSGKDLSSGIYFYSIKAGNYSETKKLVLVK